MRDSEGEGKGFGFVTMLKDEEALTAILKLNNSMFDGRKIEVRFKLKVSETTEYTAVNMRNLADGFLAIVKHERLSKLLISLQKLNYL